MKLKNIVVGGFVQIKKSMFHLEFEAGEICEVIDIEPGCKYGIEVLIQGKNSRDWVSRKDLKKPKLKTLGQSVFDGLSERWQFAAVDKSGEAWIYTGKPVREAAYWHVLIYPMDHIANSAGTGYDTTNWQDSLIKRETNELTGSELCKAGDLQCQ